MGLWAFFLAVLLVTCLGIATGFATGLLPGLHVNSVAAFVVATQPAWTGFLAALLPEALDPADLGWLLAGYVMTTAASHAVVEFIPSVFLGAPTEDTALATLPGHRLLFAGQGARAVALAARGAVLGAAFSAAFLVPLRLLLADPVDAAERFRPWSAAFLVFVLVALLLSDARGRPLRRAGRVAGVQGLAGVLGIATLRGTLPIDAGVVLFPLFSGLFALPNLVAGLRARRGRIPPQRTDPLGPLNRGALRTALRGSLAGAIVSWLPGLSGGAAAALASLRGRRPTSPSAFMGVLGAVSSSTTILSVAVLFMIHRARSGAAVAVDALLPDRGPWPDALEAPAALLALLLLSIIATAVASPMAVATSRMIARRFAHADPRRVALASLAVLLALVAIAAGPAGLAVAALAGLVGSVPLALRVRRVHLMASLLVPALLTYLAPG